MKWNWQQLEWANFAYDPTILKGAEDKFILESGKLIGASSIISKCESNRFMIELMSEEALKSSKIEGELLSRDSVASSLLQQLGLAPEYSDHQANDKERGIAALMVDNYQTFNLPLSQEMLLRWHPYIISPSWHIKDIGKYRTSLEPMQVVSGYEGQYKVHFEAPPSQQVPSEMNKFITWFNSTSPNSTQPLPPLLRAAIAHLYFVSIHPFEDGNGRIARAISEKALAQALGKPALFALSHAIEKERSEYYKQLEIHQKDLTINHWLAYFADTTLEAVAHAQKLIHFIVEKTRLYDRVQSKLNERQTKVLSRIFQEGMEGFKGGINANKYMKITGTSRQNTARDLQKMVKLGVLSKTGKLKGTRYWLNLGEAFDEEKRKYLAGQ
ncbi:MAG: Fic family protein [Mariprofundaceae bacterium]|nr:Fic family protein [Mariprofundaceae bacterium]